MHSNIVFKYFEDRPEYGFVMCNNNVVRHYSKRVNNQLEAYLFIS